MSTCLEHWGLREPPFEVTFAEPFFYAEGQHREALERLLYLVRDGNMGFGLLTGEIGCGKTMVASVLKNRLRGRACEVVFLESVFGDFEEVLREILAEMDAGPGGRRRRARPQRPEGDRYALIRRFREILSQRFARLRRHLVLVLDEAQQLSEEALVEIKNLTNFSSRHGGGLTVVLAGQPELAELVRALPQIDQRIGLRYHLRPLSVEETGAYVDRRMRAAGYCREGSAFRDDAKQALHEAGEGIPREINRIAKLSLDKGFTLGQDSLGRQDVEAIAEDALQQNAWSF